MDRPDGWWVRSSGQLLGRAALVASDAQLDLALLKLQDDASPYHFLGFASSANLKPGSSVLIAGYPGCEGLQTSWGAVTHTNVVYTTAADGFRSNAVIKRGSSGSPVLDLRGRVIGVHWGSDPDHSAEIYGDEPDRPLSPGSLKTLRQICHLCRSLRQSSIELA